MTTKKNTSTTNLSADFGAFAQNWWHPKGPMCALHQLNPVRVGWLMAQIKAESPSKTASQALDIGCGGGLLAESLARLDWQTTGLDPDQALIDVATAHAAQMGLKINYYATHAAIWAKKHPAKYNLVTVSEVLEHVANPAQLLQEAASCLQMGGYLFASTLNRTPQSWLGAIGLAEYVWRMVPRGTHQWQSFIKPAELKQMAQAAGLELVAITGVQNRPWLQDWVLAPHGTQINYMMLFRKVGAA
jgi:2-polyprenyl-6-hydroxyphenyl methylase / 3-demethylubiquinone-9 3-methyltransferase